jgi:riboflavin kinase/FMN adenylyltransferase
MLVYRSLDQIASPLTNPVVTIGNFDGVHLGHREIFRKLKKAAAAIDGVSVVVTFDPHPLKVISATKTVTLINTLEEKITLIDASGIDFLVIIPFDASFAAISAADFVERILVQTIGLRHLIIGYDYAFGKNREGDVLLLRRLGEQFSFTVEELQPIAAGETIYSSSLIRKMITDGAVAEVVRFLGRNFSLAGRVVHGHNRGKSLGFPTANIVTDKELLPADGVYAVKVKLADQLYDGACNIGKNPTFAVDSRSIEVFIFDFAAELYGQDIRVYFIERLRGEERFASPQLLAEAISRDVARCREILAKAQLVVYSEYLEGV